MGSQNGFLVAAFTKNQQFERMIKRFSLLQKIQDKVSLVIFDEAHKALAPTYEAIITELTSSEKIHTFVLGLTATPGRVFSHDDNTENIRLSKLFASTKITMKVAGYQSPVKYLVENGYLAKPNFYPINYESKINFDGDLEAFSESKILDKLAANEEQKF